MKVSRTVRSGGKGGKQRNTLFRPYLSLLLILPKNQGEKAMLETMVQEINATQVAPDEVLSDFVSEYDPRTRTMEWGKDPNLALPEKLQEKPPKLPSDVIL